MNEANKKHLWKLIQLTGDSLINKLPDHPNLENIKTLFRGQKY